MSDAVDLYASLLGGKQNLPPKLNQASPPVVANTAEHAEEDPDSPDTAVTDAFGNLQTLEDFLTEHQATAPAAAKPKGKPQAKARFHESDQGDQTDPQLSTYTSAGTHASLDGYELDPRMGEESPVGIGFCPFLAITKFPYKFVPTEHKQPIATAYFDSKKIYMREWDFFYAWHNGKLITFVPQIQVEALLAKINADFPIDWHFTAAHVEDGLLVNFTDTNADLRPRYLGHAHTHEQYEYLTGNAPAGLDIDSMFPPEDRSLAAFKSHMENAAYISKGKTKAKRQQKQGEVVARRQESTKQILRAQRYLGLSTKKDETSLMPDIASLSLTPLDTTKPAPHPRDLDAIFIAIDVEAKETNQSSITEVGVATLDTRDLANIAPGPNGKDWQPLIRARHFRVEEHKTHVNKQYVDGCPDRFEFASLSPAEGSEFVPRDEMASILTSCFHAPFSAALTAPTEPETEKRNLILLGHDTNADIAYCHSLGFSVLNRGNLLEVLDSAEMYRSYSRDPNTRSLGNVINAFDFSGWYLHNAGNDAVYTVWAMLAICVQDAAERGSDGEKLKREQKVEEREKMLVDAAKERAKEEGEGWERADDEDGGVAVPPMEPQPKGGRRGHGGGSGLFTMGGAPLDV